ncbi:MAG: hypothetical protein LBB11_02460 [Puniceicoccales bacterium]|jgi:hypothetical protein|nr:hypothetical protein [Puniceicoccales bacterium]
MEERNQDKFRLASLILVSLYKLALTELIAETTFSEQGSIQYESTEQRQKSSPKSDLAELYLFTGAFKLKGELEEYMRSLECPNFVVIDSQGNPIEFTRPPKDLPWRCYCYILPQRLFSKIANRQICNAMRERFSDLEGAFKERIWIAQKTLESDFHGNFDVIILKDIDQNATATIVDAKNGRVFECLDQDILRFQKIEQPRKIASPQKIEPLHEIEQPLEIGAQPPEIKVPHEIASPQKIEPLHKIEQPPEIGVQPPESKVPHEIASPQKIEPIHEIGQPPEIGVQPPESKVLHETESPQKIEPPQSTKQPQETRLPSRVAYCIDVPHKIYEKLIKNYDFIRMSAEGRILFDFETKQWQLIKWTGAVVVIGMAFVTGYYHLDVLQPVVAKATENLYGGWKFLKKNVSSSWDCLKRMGAGAGQFIARQWNRGTSFLRKTGGNVADNAVNFGVGYAIEKGKDTLLNDDPDSVLIDPAEENTEKLDDDCDASLWGKLKNKATHVASGIKSKTKSLIRAVKDKKESLQNDYPALKNFSQGLTAKTKNVMQKIEKNIQNIARKMTFAILPIDKPLTQEEIRKEIQCLENARRELDANLRRAKDYYWGQQIDVNSSEEQKKQTLKIIAEIEERIEKIDSDIVKYHSQLGIMH